MLSKLFQNSFFYAGPPCLHYLQVVGGLLDQFFQVLNLEGAVLHLDVLRDLEIRIMLHNMMINHLRKTREGNLNVAALVFRKENNKQAATLRITSQKYHRKNIQIRVKQQKTASPSP